MYRWKGPIYILFVRFNHVISVLYKQCRSLSCKMCPLPLEGTVAFGLNYHSCYLILIYILNCIPIPGALILMDLWEANIVLLLILVPLDICRPSAMTVMQKSSVLLTSHKCVYLKRPSISSWITALSSQKLGSSPFGSKRIPWMVKSPFMF